MLQENLKKARKAKGLTQESLAIKLCVARQTISKWEKGISVPDAEMLIKLAEVFDTSVSQLLESEPIDAQDNNAIIAQQLAAINEQLAIKNNRARRIWKIIIIIPVTILILYLVLMFIFVCNVGKNFENNYEVKVTSKPQIILESLAIE